MGTFCAFLCNIIGENTVKSNAWVHLVVSAHIIGENTVNSGFLII